MGEEIRIYIADLAAYNNGLLHGIWIDATLDVDEIFDQIKTLLNTSPVELAEEWALHDYEGFGSLRLSEYEGIEHLHELACFIEEHGAIACALLDNFSGEIAQCRTALEEHYCGVFASIADFAEMITEETTHIPENIAYYIDYEQMGREMMMAGEIFTLETNYEEIHIFSNC